MASETDEQTDIEEQPALRVAKRPRVYVLARPQFSEFAAEVFLADEQLGDWVRKGDRPPNNAESLCEFAGRLCYLSFGENQGRTNSEDYLANLRRMGHFSVFEHANWSLLICDVSRSLTHELVRHRHFSYSQQSSRYVMPHAEVVLPPQLADRPALAEVWTEDMREALGAQEALGVLYEQQEVAKARSSEDPWTPAVKREVRKRAREVGRSAMPHAAVTRIVMTGNARAWRWFLEMRGGEGAEPEIRRLAVEYIYPLLLRESPYLFAGFSTHDGDNGRTLVLDPS